MYRKQILKTLDAKIEKKPDGGSSCRVKIKPAACVAGIKEITGE